MRVLHPIAVVALILALIAPLVPLGVWSLARGWRFPDLLPQDWTWAAWTYALSPVSGVLGSLGVTLAIAAAWACMGCLSDWV
jgi:putative spermidine/putrescine transport system permease protein